MGMTDPNDIFFNDRVEATAFAGEVRTELREFRRDFDEVRSDVKHIRSTVDRWGGAVAIIGAAISALVSFAVALFRP